MNLYIFLCTFDRSGIEQLVSAGTEEFQKRLDDLAALCGTGRQKTTIENIWFTTGESVDLVVIVKAANIDDAVALSIAVSSIERCKVTTLVASDVAKVAKAAKAAVKAHTKIGGDKGGGGGGGRRS